MNAPPPLSLRPPSHRTLTSHLQLLDQCARHANPRKRGLPLLSVCVAKRALDKWCICFVCSPYMQIQNISIDLIYRHWVVIRKRRLPVLFVPVDKLMSKQKKNQRQSITQINAERARRPADCIRLGCTVPIYRNIFIWRLWNGKGNAY